MGTPESFFTAKTWDEWDVPVTISHEELRVQRETLMQTYLTPFGGENFDQKLEQGTLPTSLSSLFGSHPVDDILSLVTCKYCNLKFRTQTSHYHLNNCHKRTDNKKKYPSVSTSQCSSELKKPKNLTMLERNVKVRLAALTVPIKLNSNAASNLELNESDANSNLSSTTFKPNLVPPLIIKREPYDEKDSKTAYKTLLQVQRPTGEGSSVPAASDTYNIGSSTKSTTNLSLETLTIDASSTKKMVSVGRLLTKTKKSQELPRKLIPLKDRQFNPEEHCGVATGLDGHPCTRSLTCKTHSVALRRAVGGRSQSFDVLLASHKKSRDQAKFAKCGVEENINNQPVRDCYEFYPNGIPQVQGTPIFSKLGGAQNKSVLTSANIKGIKRLSYSPFKGKNPDRASSMCDTEKTQPSKLEKIMAFRRLLEESYDENRKQQSFSKEYGHGDQAEEENWISLPLERVKVARPAPKPPKKKDPIMERWKKGELSQLELLQAGIMKAKMANMVRERENNGDLTMKKRSTSPKIFAGEETKRFKQNTTKSLFLDMKNRSPISFSILPRGCGRSQATGVRNGHGSKSEMQDHNLITDKLRNESNFCRKSSNENFPFSSQSKFLGCNIVQTSYATELNSDSPTSAAGSMALPVTEETSFENSLIKTESVEQPRTELGRTVESVYHEASKTDQKGVPSSWAALALSQEIGGRSPHDAPVSDSELSNLLAAQFED